MNANLPPKMPAINDWVAAASKKLEAAGILSGVLDAEIILAHTLRKPRTYLHAHPEEPVPPRERDIADARLQLRLERTPIAYIIGHKEFYGRQFKVTPATLIPRPESEMMIELLKKHLKRPNEKKLVDVGTGSGCLGITAKLEFPELDVTLIDISRHALAVADTNARRHSIDIQLIHSDLLALYPFSADIILANLPYVDKTWQRSPETNYEPAEALFASDNGLHLIFKLIDQTDSHIAPEGLLLLEADPRQHEEIKQKAYAKQLELLEVTDFILLFRKI